MTKASLDRNGLIYAALEPQTDKGRRARGVILRWKLELKNPRLSHPAHSGRTRA